MKSTSETHPQILSKFIAEEMSDEALAGCAQRAARFARRRGRRRVAIAATASLLTVLIVVSVTIVLTRPAHAEVEFSGLFVTSQKTLLTFTDSDERTNSGWITIGQIFSGYKVEAYDAKTESVTLSKQGRFYRVLLKTPTIKEALITLEGEVTLSADQKIKVERAVLPLDAQTTFPLNERVVVHITPSRTADPSLFPVKDLKELPADALFYSVVFENTAPDADPKILSAPTVLSRTGQKFGIKVNENLEFWFRPKT